MSCEKGVTCRADESRAPGREYKGTDIYVIAYGVGNCSVFFENINDFYRLVWYNVFVVQSDKLQLEELSK